MKNIKRLKKEMIKICHQMYKKGFINATDGNVSVRFEKHEILITRSGTHKGFLTLEDILITDLTGAVVSGKGKPSSEIRMHLEVYSRRDDVKAVIHAHPPLCTAFSLSGSPIPTVWLPEVYLIFGNEIPLASYATPSTQEVPEAISPYLKNHDALILSRHGSLTLGENLWEAFCKLEKMENTAWVTFFAKMIGNPKPMNNEELNLLAEIKSKMGAS